MSNTQFIYSLERIQHLMSNDGVSNWDTCRCMLNRIIKICGPFRGRKSFPCLQDQSIIITLLNVAQRKPEAREHLLPQFEVVLDIISEHMDRSLVEDRGFIVQFFDKMVKLRCYVKEIIGVLSEFYADNGDVFAAELYWGVLTLIMNQKDVLQTLPQEATKEIISMIFDAASESTTPTGAVTAALSLMSSLIMNQWLWSDLLMDGGEYNAINRAEFTNTTMLCCRNLVFGQDISLNESQHSALKKDSDYDMLYGSRESKEDTMAGSRLSYTGNECPTDAETHTAVVILAKLHPSQMVAVVIAMLACGHVDGQYWRESMQTGYEILYFLLRSSGRCFDIHDKATKFPTSSKNGVTVHTAVVLVTKALVYSLHAHASAPSSVGSDGDHCKLSSPCFDPVVHSNFLTRITQTLTMHVLRSCVVGSLHTMCADAAYMTPDYIHLLTPLYLMFPMGMARSFDTSSLHQIDGNGQRVVSSKLSNDLVSRVRAFMSKNNPMYLSEHAIELVFITVECLHEECKVTGWTGSALKMFAEQCMYVVCQDISLQTHGDFVDIYTPAGGGTNIRKATGDNAAVTARICRVFELLDLTFACMNALSTADVFTGMKVNSEDGPETSANDMNEMLYRVAQLIYPSLFDSLSCAVLSCAGGVVTTGCRLLAKICAAFPDDFLGSTMEWLCCTFSRSLGEGILSNGSPVIGEYGPKTLFPMRICILAGLGETMELLIHGNTSCHVPARGVFELSLLRGILTRLLELFTGLANDCLASAIQLSSESSRPIVECLCEPSSLSMGLCFLLYPIAAVMECMATTCKSEVERENIVCFDIPRFRTLWMHISLLQFTDRLRWADNWVREIPYASHSRVCSAIDKITKHTPPLVDFNSDGHGVGYLERELAYCPVAKVVSKYLPDSRISDASVWIDQCTGFTILGELISRPAIAKLSSRNLGTLLYISAVRYLEGLRIKSQLEGRPLFFYFYSKEITSSAFLQDAIVFMAQEQLFGVWERVVMGNRNSKIRRRAIMTLFQFVVTHSIHALKIIRDLAHVYIDRVYQCSPWVYWHVDGVFTLFECVEVLSCLKLSESTLLPQPQCMCSNPWSFTLFLDDVPPIEFPGSNEALSAVAKSTMTKCYEWFSEASHRASWDIYEILHEYIVICGNDEGQGTNIRYSDTGVSIANELCSSRRPTYHMVRPDSKDIDLFYVERVIASRSITKLHTSAEVDSGVEITALHSRSRALMSKIRHVGEANGIVTMAMSAMHAVEADKCQVDLVQTVLKPCYEYFEAALSRSHWPAYTEDLISAMIVKAASLLRELCILTGSGSRDRSVKSTCFQSMLSASLVNEHAMVTMRYFAALLQCYFGSPVVSTLIFVWRWLASSSPLLRSLVMKHVMDCFSASSYNRLGLFHKHTKSCSENRASENSDCHMHDLNVRNVTLLRHGDVFDEVSDTPFLLTRLKCCKVISACPLGYKAHEDWIDYISEALSTHCDHVDTIFDAIESTLHHEYFSTDSSSLVARFKLLTLALRLLKDSLLSSSTSARQNKRHIMRERIIHLALLWFVEPVSFAGIISQQILGEYFVLKKFCDLLMEDCGLWVVDYSNDVLFELDEGGVTHAQPVYNRGPGATYALKHLRHLMNRDAKDAHHHRHRCHRQGSTSSRHLGIDIPVEEVDCLDYVLHRSGIIWLLRALIYDYMDSLIAAAPSATAHRREFFPVSEIKSFKVAYAALFKVPDKTFKSAIEVAWVIHPSLALSFADRFKSHLFDSHHTTYSAHTTHKAISTLLDFISCCPLSVRNDYRAVSFLHMLDSHAMKHRPRPSIMKELMHWAICPVAVAINLLDRRPTLAFTSWLYPSNTSLHTVPYVLQYVIRSLRALKASHATTLQFFLPQLVQLLRRDMFGAIASFLTELSASSTLLCHQLIWLLELESYDENESNSVEAHSNSESSIDSKKHSAISLRRRRRRHGHCNALRGPDPLPRLAGNLLHTTRSVLSPSAKAYLETECKFFNKVTNISAKLMKVKNKELHNAIIRESLLQLGKPDNIYLPTDPTKAIVNIVVDSGAPMQSAAKCPYLLIFHTTAWGGPDSIDRSCDDLAVLSDPSPVEQLPNPGPQQTELSPLPSTLPDVPAASITSPIPDRQALNVSPIRRGIGKMDSASFKSPKLFITKTTTAGLKRSDSSASEEPDSKEAEVEMSKHSDTILIGADVDTVDGLGRSLSLSSHASEIRKALGKEEICVHGDCGGDGESTSHEYNRVPGDQRPTKSLKSFSNGSGIDRTWRHGVTRAWAKLRESAGHPMSRIRGPFRPSLLARNQSSYPMLTQKKVGIDACIFKVYDDCRQDALTIQVIRILRDAFEAVHLPLYLVPYGVIPNRTGLDMAMGGILEVVANVKSRDQLGKEGAKTLKQHFINQFGDEESPAYKQAQVEFARSLAGSAIVCYLLSIKDRHNGNILLDEEGHILHIDFGFLLGISPGGNLGFENAAFKLSKEMVDVMGGYEHSDVFKAFEDLTVQGFLVARSVMDSILTVVSAMVDSGLPCFLHKVDNIAKMQERFFPHCSDSEAARLMRGLVKDAARKWTTVAYDGIQKLQNNIYSDSWK